LLAKVSGDYQRLNRHKFETVEVKTLRLQVKATNGSALVSVFEVRCYG
jgi:hypothetical protein